MEILPLHIEYLLTRHDCVIVPGLGAFIATESEACIDIENGIVRPRRREISFNSSVVTDDGLLSHSVARREHMRYEDAHRRVNSIIEKMKEDLRNEGEISLGMLGRLVSDTEGLISYQPRKSYSCQDILSDIKLDISGKEVAQYHVAESEQPEKSSEDIPEVDDNYRTIRVAPDKYVFTISKRAVHAAAMLIMIFTVGLSLLIPMNHDNEQKASVISLDEFFRRELKTDSQNIDDFSNRITVENDSIADSVVSSSF